MKIYKIEVDIGKISNQEFSVLAKDFKEAVEKANKMIEQTKPEYEDAEVLEVRYYDDVSEVE